MQGDRNAVNQRIAGLQRALIVAVVVAVVLGIIAVLFFADLLTIGPCNGGLGGPKTCPGPIPEFQVEQLGHSQIVNGTYVCSFIVYPQGPPTLYSTALTVWAQNLSGARLNLLSVVLYSNWGSVLANYSSSGTSWTTNHAVEILEPEILTVTSSTDLIGQQVVISDPGTQVGAFLDVS